MGRIEEICARQQGAHTVVTEFHICPIARFERLSGARIGRAIMNILRLRKKGEGYRVPWNRLDLSDPARPRLTCNDAELRALVDVGAGPR